MAMAGQIPDGPTDAMQVLSLADLPAEMLMKIFLFLPLQDVVTNIRATCERFHNITFDGNFTKSIHMQEFDANFPSQKMCQLIADSPSLKDFHFDSGKRVDKRVLRQLSQHASLEGLFLRDIALKYKRATKMFLVQCKALKTLSFDSVKDFEFWRVIARSHRLGALQNIETLYLEGCSFIEDDSLILLAESCPKLKHISLSKLNNMSDKSVDRILRIRGHMLTGLYIDTIDLTYSLQELVRCTKLKELELYSWPYSTLRFPDHLPVSPDLTYLSLKLCMFSDEYIVKVLSRYPTITQLNLKGCKYASSWTAKTILSFPNLTYLNITKCNFSRDNIVDICTNLRQIRCLELSLFHIQLLSLDDTEKALGRIPVLRFEGADTQDMMEAAKLSHQLPRVAIYARNYSDWRRIREDFVSDSDEE